MVSPKTLKLRAIRPRRTLLGPYVAVTEKDSTATQYVRDASRTTFASRDGTMYHVEASGALRNLDSARYRGVKPHPRGGVRRMKFSR